MDGTFRIGRRFRKIKYLCAAANVFVVFVFYFIYRQLLLEAFPNLAGAPLALAFLGIGLAVAKCTVYIADKYARAISYQVTEEGLRVVQGRSVRTLPWAGFQGARLRTVFFQGPFPVEFQVDGESLVLNQYIDELYALTDEIFQRAPVGADISPELRKQAQAMRGVY